MLPEYKEKIMHHLLHTAAIILAFAEGIPFVLGGFIGFKIGKRRRG